MARFVAFLRAINVGGHIVKMEHLRRSFEALGFTAVETFIASGNVIFEATARTEETLRKRIEAKLEADLGYAVATFLRTAAEVQAIASYEAFSEASFRTADSRLFVAFLQAEVDRGAGERLLREATAVDEFRIDGREVYWLCHASMKDSKFSAAKLEKIAGAAATLRNVNTVRRLADKLAAEAAIPKKRGSSSARK